MWAQQEERDDWVIGTVNQLFDEYASESAEDIPALNETIKNQLFLSPTMNELITTYMRLFVNQTEIWGKQWVKYVEGDEGQVALAAPYAIQKPEMDTKGGRYPYKPLTVASIRQMFAGDLSCALLAVDRNLSSKWLCFDSDRADGDMDTLEAFASQCGWQGLREGAREGRDGHLWYLFDRPVPVDKLIVLGNACIELAGIATMEFFPKSAGINQVRAPFSVNLKPEASGARGWFAGCSERDIRTQIQWLAQQSLNSGDDAIDEADTYLHRMSGLMRKGVSKKQSNSNIEFYDDFDIRQHVDLTKHGSRRARCPLCADLGQDLHEDNLTWSEDGKKFTCVSEGPGIEHKAYQIRERLLRN